MNPAANVVNETASDVDRMKVDDMRTTIKELRKIINWF